jgi:hypothetical protein
MLVRCPTRQRWYRGSRTTSSPHRALAPRQPAAAAATTARLLQPPPPRISPSVMTAGRPPQLPLRSLQRAVQASSAPLRPAVHVRQPQHQVRAKQAASRDRLTLRRQQQQLQQQQQQQLAGESC